MVQFYTIQRMLIPHQSEPFDHLVPHKELLENKIKKRVTQQ